MYDLDVTFESNVSQERTQQFRARFAQYAMGLVGSCLDNCSFLARCLCYAAFDMGCELPMFFTVRRYVPGSATCECVDFTVAEPLRTVLFGLRSVKSYPGYVVDVGFETDQDSFWIHLPGNCYDVS